MARSVFLVTYSQVDRELCEDKEEFAKLVTGEFKDCKIEQWVCAEEKHNDGGSHFHLALKLDRIKRWKQVRTRIQERYKICVNFSEHHSNYYNAYTYVCKEDKNVLRSANHKVYSGGSPQTSKASRARLSLGKNVREQSPAAACGKFKRLDVIDVYDVIVSKNIRTDLELCGLAQAELEDGKKDMANFLLKKSEKNRNEILKTAWKMQNAKSRIERLNKGRMEILDEISHSQCVCEGQWLQSANEILSLNDISKRQFVQAVKTALLKGRGKKQNVMLTGPTNCGKSFLFDPLKAIFKAFVNPANGTFAWVGAESAEVVYLNDFRWSEKLMGWTDLLNLLEGAPVHISAPKTHFSEDILWTKDTPIFCTTNARIRKYEHGQINEIETEMMDARWVVFPLRHQFRDPKKIKCCCKCFTEFLK